MVWQYWSSLVSPPASPHLDREKVGFLSLAVLLVFGQPQVYDGVNPHRRLESTMKCPDCGLENPPSALRCDCGYVLPAHEMPNSTQKRHSLLFWMFAWLLFGLRLIFALFILVGGLFLARSFLGRNLIAFLGSLLAIPLAVAIVAILYRIYRNSCWRCRSFATMSLKRKYQEGDNSVEILQCGYCGYTPKQPFGPVDSSS